MALRRELTSPPTRRDIPITGEWTPHVIVTALGLVASAALIVVSYLTDKSTITGRLNDFYREAWPSYHALIHGHPLEFLQLGPAYIGSLVLRAPFALVPSLWGGGARATYYASAVPCLIALVAFCTWLAAKPRRRGGVGWASRASPVVIAFFSPIVLMTMLIGHPEEILGAVLCVAGVALAVRGKAGWAGILIGLAVANKTWALVAVPVALAVMPSERRRAALVMAGAAAAVLVPVMALRGNGLSAAATGTGIGTMFYPHQLLWWFGPHSWVAQHARWIIILAAAACAGLWSASPHANRSRGSMPDALLLLALVLLLRAALDPWDNLYYHLPFIFALMAYEVYAGRPPLLALGCSVLLFVIIPPRGILHISYGARAPVYAAFALPTICWLAAKLYLPDGLKRRISLALPRGRSHRLTRDEVAL
jgi:hypothetical protein